MVHSQRGFGKHNIHLSGRRERSEREREKTRKKNKKKPREISPHSVDGRTMLLNDILRLFLIEFILYLYNVTYMCIDY